jgi:hypothetical protein
MFIVSIITDWWQGKYCPRIYGEFPADALRPIPSKTDSNDTSSESERFQIQTRATGSSSMAAARDMK